MNNRHFILIVTMVFITTKTACKSKNSEYAKMVEFAQKYTAAWNIKQPEKMASFYAEDGTLMGMTYIIYHFNLNGFNLNFNIMIFTFIILGLALHQTPMRYVIAMKRSSTNISSILFQYPFYAGIMGIMISTGLGEKLAEIMASVANKDTYPFFAYVTGGIINFAIPSGGGEFAVVGPSILNAVKEIGSGLPALEVTEMISRASLSIAYGESLTNLLQPFYLLLVFPIMSAAIKIQARDIMGYLVLPFIVFFTIQSLLVTWMPI